MTFDPTSVENTCVMLPKDNCIKSHGNTSKYVDTVAIFKIFDQKVNAQMTPRWPLTPPLLGSHVQLYPRIIVSNSHKYTSKHVDTVTFFFQKLYPKVSDP